MRLSLCSLCFLWSTLPWHSSGLNKIVCVCVRLCLCGILVLVGMLCLSLLDYRSDEVLIDSCNSLIGTCAPPQLALYGPHVQRSVSSPGPGWQEESCSSGAAAGSGTRPPRAGP